MPIYEYECRTCGHKLEAIQKMSDAVLSDCPACNQSTLQKLVSAAGFQLKGTGWYVTDFKNKPQSSTSDSSSGDSGSTESSSGGTSSSTDKTDKKAN